MTRLSGQCLCGDVAFVAEGEITRTSACHCRMCRVQNGGGAFHSAEIQGELEITKDVSLKFFAASEKAERGFCSNCGSSLFWRLTAHPSFMDISLGALDDDSTLKLDAHIFTDDGGSYETIPTDVPHLTAAEVLAKYSNDN